MSSYCSKDCQKQFWSVHKKSRQPQSYSNYPVHAINSYGCQDENYFTKTNDPDQGDRPSIKLCVETGTDRTKLHLFLVAAGVLNSEMPM